jgi:hypothetical protein
MISERKFANSYASFWNQLLPTADAFVRKINLASERFCRPIDAVSKDRNKRAVINELAFRLFKVIAAGNEIEPDMTDNLEKGVRDYIEKLIHSGFKIPALSKEEVAESERIAASLSMYFSKTDISPLKFWPLFKGCGQLDACRADIISGSKLIEVKAGERNFKITDVRQVITYLALNFNSGQYSIIEIALVNPRTGLKFECEADMLIEFCSGRKAVDIFSDIVEFISSETGSK